MGKQRSFRSKAAHFVSDVTTVLLNPISDKTSKPSPDDASENAQLDPITEEKSVDSVDGPDTTSFTAFLYSLLSSPKPENLDDKNDDQVESDDQPSDTTVSKGSGKKSLLSGGKQSLRRLYQVARLSGSQNQEHKRDCGSKVNNKDDINSVGVEMGQMKPKKEPEVSDDCLVISEQSMLLSKKTMNTLYSLLPALVQGRRWFFLYSTWRHGISLGTLYRRSALWPGLSLLVVGDRKGAVFGGLVEAPLKPTNKRYQGTNSTFVFTNKSGHPVIFRPTGANHYFTLCSRDYLALGGGGHFALYLDNELLIGSSSVSETYGNPCLAHTEDFEVKEVELWGFVYPSKYEELLELSQTEEHGICRF